MKKILLLSGLTLFASVETAFAHAIVGDRVFPATMAVDDPGVSDELNTQASRTKSPDGWGTDLSAEFDKRITDNFGLSVEGDWLSQSGKSGFDNPGVGAKYVFYTNAPHETMFSAGLDWDIGNVGAKRFADNFSTLTPTLFFGKGLGDLPDSMNYLKPLAVTGSLGLAVPTERYSADDDGDRSLNPNVMEWGATLQYSIPYLQQHVKDEGITGFLATAVPVVEFSMETPTGGDSRVTTGTINPGVIFMGHEIQLGFEAVIPVNQESGNRMGAIAQLHFYLDDLYPQTMRPLW